MKALITANVDEENLDRLKNDLDMDVEYRPISERDGRFSPAEVKELLDGVEVFVVGYEAVSAEIIESAGSLEIIGCPRGGPDANVDIAAATERGIPVLYAPGRNAVSVADFTLGLLLGVARRIPHAHRLLHEGSYTGQPRTDAAGGGGERKDVTWGMGRESPYANLKGPELESKTIGIVGFGAIGRLVAKRATGFGLDSVAFDPFVDADTMAEHGVEKVGLDEACERSDFVTIHSPVTDETRGMIGAEQFEMMGPEAFFINTARAAVTNRDALIDALEAGTIRGAALDVYAEEPLPADHPLLDLPTVVTTPHIAGAAEEVPARGATMIVDDIEAVMAGRTPTHIANEAVLDAEHTGQGDEDGSQ